MFIYDLKAINLHLLLHFTVICSFLFQAALPFTNIKNTKIQKRKNKTKNVIMFTVVVYKIGAKDLLDSRQS